MSNGESSAQGESGAFVDRVIQRGRLRLQNAPWVHRFDLLSRRQLQEFARQFWLFVDRFPRFLASLIGNCPDVGLRQVLVANLVDECGGVHRLSTADVSRAHPLLFVRFCRALGLTEDDLRVTRPSAGTRLLILEHEEAACRSPFLHGLGVIGLAGECQADKWVAVLEGLRSRNEFSEDELEFFAAHQPADEQHGTAIRNFLKRCLDKEDDRRLIESGAEAGITSRVAFWESLEQQLSTERS